MGKRQFVNKKNATTFQLVHRSQRDPEIHNDEATQRVFVPIQTISKSGEGGSEARAHNDRKTVQTRRELEQEFEGKARENEGEAAEYGVYYDDTGYDYMQHLRPTGNLGAVMLENPASVKEGKKKAAFELPDDVRPSTNERPKNYQDQQAIQDSIAGFKPDLDPRIREVMEALENEEEAPEDDSEDWFQELTKDGVLEEGEDDVENGVWGDEEDDGWDSDDTAKAAPTNSSRAKKSEWEQEFSKFKKAGAGAIDEEGSIVSTAFTAASTGRIRHGNGSIGTGFSMSSSALYRTEGLTLLDDRFDKVEREYDIEEEDEDEPQYDPSAPMRGDFDSIMDDFLGEYANMGNKGATKRSRNPYTLDDARIALGNTKISSTSKA
ncbi:Protein LTV1 [Taphrina deformans PYCC 5710]|uniref:Protein LTV1 n=1 Tax=Taphrina deformans (strain PYCC 5710 / ATCC 11124 / CBS 356.35 / IMI 108563 / JCM 9778 / NBRC 8474) TaxID=1097556 RepID=R4X8W8_TAPDE|nr:Protein LTV1 [Taphrina deformans PYCC 5710]|eukprot:CCG81875.1 Protein LTV1 [Taphrina deformans PYCC 5710]